MKIVVLGGNGLLGEYLSKEEGVIPLSRLDCDITEIADVKRMLSAMQPDVVINSAAVINDRDIAVNSRLAVEVNIKGASNVALACYEYNTRLVYLSTDYVYKGDRGNYKETDEIYPFNLYAWTKLGGECATKIVNNHLIIRTSFGCPTFEYSVAFTDKWTSKDYVDVIAREVYLAAKSPLTGVLNIGTDRKTIYDYATKRNHEVGKTTIAETSFNTPVDTSLNLQKWIDYKSKFAHAKEHTNCRACGSDNLVKYLDLGLMPLSNNLEQSREAGKSADRYPLQVMFCEECGLSQLSVVINPEKMFSYYTYRSSVNGGYVKHCKQMARNLKKKFGLSSESSMIDIAGNDGALLQEFYNEIGLSVLNIDPASNLCAIAEANGVPSLSMFWGDSKTTTEAKRYFRKHVDLITATNVFAHVDDTLKFLVEAKEALKLDGHLVLEFPYLVDFIERNEFDTIYFEHLSYFSIIPLSRLCARAGMKIVDVEKFDIHGGTVRVTIVNNECLEEPSANVYSYTEYEMSQGYTEKYIYFNWSDKIHSLINEFQRKIINFKKQKKTIACFAASAKGNTLLNSANLDYETIDFIADETPEKIGKYSPGTGIPIVHKNFVKEKQPDYLIILSWNFKDEIINKIKDDYRGKYVIPIPELEFI